MSENDYTCDSGAEPDDYPDDNEILADIIGDFSRVLTQKLVSNGRGLSYLESEPSWLLMRLQQEVLELAYAIDCEPLYRQAQEQECLDVAAFAMMLWHRLKQERGER